MLIHIINYNICGEKKNERGNTLFVTCQATCACSDDHRELRGLMKDLPSQQTRYNVGTRTYSSIIQHRHWELQRRSSSKTILCILQR